MTSIIDNDYDTDDDIIIRSEVNERCLLDYDDITEKHLTNKYNATIISSNITFHETITPLSNLLIRLEKIENIKNSIRDLYKNQTNIEIHNIYVYKNQTLDNDYIIEHKSKSIKEIETLSDLNLQIKECYNYKNDLYKSEFYIVSQSLKTIIYIITYPNIQCINNQILIKEKDLSNVKIKQIINLKKFSINIIFALLEYLKKIGISVLLDNINEAFILREIENLQNLERLLLIDYKTSKLPIEIKSNIFKLN